MSGQSNKPPGSWQVWRFNPRFYRSSGKGGVFAEIYWVFGFEFLAMLALGVGIYFGSIRPGQQQKRRDMEIYQRLRQLEKEKPGEIGVVGAPPKAQE